MNNNISVFPKKLLAPFCTLCFMPIFFICMPWVSLDYSYHRPIHNVTLDKNNNSSQHHNIHFAGKSVELKLTSIKVTLKVLSFHRHHNNTNMSSSNLDLSNSDNSYKFCIGAICDPKTVHQIQKLKFYSSVLTNGQKKFSETTKSRTSIVSYYSHNQSFLSLFDVSNTLASHILRLIPFTTNNTSGFVEDDMSYDIQILPFYIASVFGLVPFIISIGFFSCSVVLLFLILLCDLIVMKSHKGKQKTNEKYERNEHDEESNNSYETDEQHEIQNERARHYESKRTKLLEAVDVFNTLGCGFSLYSPFIYFCLTFKEVLYIKRAQYEAGFVLSLLFSSSVVILHYLDPSFSRNPPSIIKLKNRLLKTRNRF